MNEPKEIWFERVAGGGHMPTTSKGLWLTLKFFMGALVLILIAAGTAKLLFGNGVAAVAAAILGVLSVLRFSQIADRHSR